MVETTALGAAIAAGLAVGVWSSPQDPRLSNLTRVEKRFEPALPMENREARLRQWKRAVERSIGWAADS